METTETFKNSPIHDKRRILETMDELSPGQMVELVDCLQKIAKNLHKPLVSGSLPLVDFEVVQSELNKSFDNIRMGAEHTLYLNEKFEVRKRQ